MQQSQKKTTGEQLKELFNLASTRPGQGLEEDPD